jgi:hypothetical protein
VSNTQPPYPVQMHTHHERLLILLSDGTIWTALRPEDKWHKINGPWQGDRPTSMRDTPPGFCEADEKV